MAPLCKFWARGDCKNGDSCRFEHPRDLGRNDNRFAPLQTNESNSRNNYGRSQNDGRSTPPQNPSYTLNREAIIADLSTERPQWILSAYGPAPKGPAQLFGGSIREQSFEEMRLHHYTAAPSGNAPLAIQQAETLVREAESQMQNVLNDIDGAIEFIRKAEKEHPNRNDICQNSTTITSAMIASTNNPFAANNAAPTRLALGFGQPSIMGAKPNPFGVPNQAFSQPSMPGPVGGFGQPSALGQKTNPFGAPSGVAAGGFGQPSALGQKASPFGTPSGGASSTQGANVLSAPFSAFAGAQTPFGVASQLVALNQFAQNSQPTNPFGQPVQPTQAVVNPFAQTAPRPNPFGQTTGQNTSQPQNNPFAMASPISSNAPITLATQNPFGTPQQPARQAAPSQPPFNQQSSTVGLNPFGNPSVLNNISRPNPFAPSAQISLPTANDTVVQSTYGPSAKAQHPPLESYSSRDASQNLTMFKGKPVIYKNGEAGFQNRDGSWEKIWFPEGPPAYYSATELDDKEYTEDTKAAYVHLKETGSFADGIMPLLPPKREWCLWDF